MSWKSVLFFSFFYPEHIHEILECKKYLKAILDFWLNKVNYLIIIIIIIIILIAENCESYGSKCAMCFIPKQRR
jgi:hypothetical protein